MGFQRSVHNTDKIHYGNTFDRSSLQLQWISKSSLLLCHWRALCRQHLSSGLQYLPAAFYWHWCLLHVMLQEFLRETAIKFYCSLFHFNIHFIFKPAKFPGILQLGNQVFPMNCIFPPARLDFSKHGNDFMNYCFPTVLLVIFWEERTKKNNKESQCLTPDCHIETFCPPKPALGKPPQSLC